MSSSTDDTTQPRKSSVLTDDDYRVAKPWVLDQAAAFRNIRNQGSNYDGILEAVQNAIDSPRDKYNDINNIRITIPLLGDKDYRIVVAIVSDQGAGITKDFDGQIQKFLNREKGLSPKQMEQGVRRFGIGMIQFAAASPVQIIISQDKEFIYRIPILLNKEGMPAYGDWSFHKITPENVLKYNAGHNGTTVYFVDAYEDMIDIDPMKLAKMIRQTFGWRLLLQPKTRIMINETIVIDLPDYLKEIRPKFICRLKRTVVTDTTGRKRTVDPEVTGQIDGDSKGRGMLQVHAGGYYIGEIFFAHKRFRGAINIDEMPTDPSRRVMIHEAMKVDLEKHIIDLTRHFPDIPTDQQQMSDKKKRTLDELFAKIMAPLDIPALMIEEFERQKQKRKEGLGTANTPDSNTPGYRKRETETLLPEFCNLCHHRKYKGKRRRKTCDCPCHIGKERGPNKKRGTASTDGTDTIMFTEDELTTIKERSQPKIDLHNKLEPTDRYVQFVNGILTVNVNHPIWELTIGSGVQVGVERILKDMVPFIAGAYMDLKNSLAITEMSLDDFRKEQDRITATILGEF